jgi:hypothetical protein
MKAAVQSAGTPDSSSQSRRPIVCHSGDSFRAPPEQRMGLAEVRNRQFAGLSWARLGSNQRPLACEAIRLPLQVWAVCREKPVPGGASQRCCSQAFAGDSQGFGPETGRSGPKSEARERLGRVLGPRGRRRKSCQSDPLVDMSVTALIVHRRAEGGGAEDVGEPAASRSGRARPDHVDGAPSARNGSHSAKAERGPISAPAPWRLWPLKGRNIGVGRGEDDAVRAARRRGGPVRRGRARLRWRRREAAGRQADEPDAEGFRPRRRAGQGLPARGPLLIVREAGSGWSGRRSP